MNEQIYSKKNMDNDGVVHKNREGSKISLSRKYLIFLIILLIFLLYNPREGLYITVLDVGQGDGIFLESPSGRTYLIDGGSTSSSKVGQYIIQPYLKSQGISNIDYMIATHMDEDHINGLLELIEMIPDEGSKPLETYITVQNLILPKLREPDDTYLKFVSRAEGKGISIIYMSAGMSLQDGDVMITCLHPAYAVQSTDKNEYSLVLFLDYKNFQMLFTGDVEGAGEEQLLDVIQDESNIDGLSSIEVLKVAHHGSKNSTPEELLAILEPKISIISCGLNNSYGHPHEELLERLEAVESQIYKTAECGAITIWTDGEKMKIETYVGRKNKMWGFLLGINMVQ